MRVQFEVARPFPGLLVDRCWIEGEEVWELGLEVAYRAVGGFAIVVEVLQMFYAKRLYLVLQTRVYQ